MSLLLTPTLLLAIAVLMVPDPDAVRWNERTHPPALQPRFRQPVMPSMLSTPGELTVSLSRAEFEAWARGDLELVVEERKP